MPPPTVRRRGARANRRQVRQYRSPSPIRRSPQLERIRTQHLALGDPATGQKADSPRCPLFSDGIQRAWQRSKRSQRRSAGGLLPCSAQGPAVEEQLRNTVILIDPCINPDGHDRFVDGVNGNRGAQISD